MQYSFASPAKMEKTESINPQAAFVFFTILFGFFEILFLLLEKTKSINSQVILVTVKVKVKAAFVFILVILVTPRKPSITSMKRHVDRTCSISYHFVYNGFASQISSWYLKFLAFIIARGPAHTIPFTIDLLHRFPLGILAF